MNITKALAVAAAFGLATPVLAASHSEKKDATGAPVAHGTMDHGKMDTTTMSKKDKAAHAKMMKDAAKKDAMAADKMATPK